MSNDTNVTVFPFPPAEGLVRAWWIEMVVVSIFNCFFFIYAFWKTRTNLHYCHDKHLWSYRYCFWMRLLAFPYVIECTYRSFFPTQYNYRVTIVDDMRNSVVVTRSMAFIGEICWGIQIGWCLSVVSLTLGLRGPRWLKTFIRNWFPRFGILIALLATVGNIFSCIGAITTNNVFPAIEESLWGILFFISGICCFTLWTFGVDSWSFQLGSNCFGWDINPFDDPNKEFHHDTNQVWIMRFFIRGFALFSLGGVPYIFFIDVPKYVERLAQDTATNKTYLGFSEGLYDAAYTRNPSQEDSVWKSEFFWMSAYFSVAVWTSILMMWAPGKVEPAQCHCNTGRTESLPGDNTGAPIVAHSHDHA